MTRRGFTATDAALTINYIGFVFRTLVAEGHDPSRLLLGTGLSEEALLDPDFRCTFEQHETFVLNALEETDDPHLGPRMGARFNPINIGLPASAALSSDTFATALDIMRQFVSLNFSILSFDHYEEGDHLIVRLQPVVDVGKIEYFVLGSSLVVCENFFKLLLNEDRVTDRVELALPEPPGWESFGELVGIPVHFNAPSSRMILPRGSLDKPLAGTDPLVNRNMLRLCEKQLAESYYGESLEAQVRQVVTRRHFHSVPIEEASVELGLSERSLRRQLSQSGTSYKKVVDNLRESRARELLAVPGLPVTTIAYDLGFSDPSNFARTFKRWAGLSPQEYRENLPGGQN